MDEQRLGVVGAGVMGSGIAQVAAQAGYTVTLVDVRPTQLDRALATMAAGLARYVERGRITAAERKAALQRVTTGLTLSDLADAPLIIEAVIEEKPVKINLLQELDRIAAADAILASNTSTLPITELAAATRRPGRVIGMHFFNPAPVMRLVEVIRGLETTDETVSAVVTTAEALGKTAVVVRDSPGFISSRLLAPMIN